MTVLRPGIALGPYPERDEEKPGFVERAFARAVGAMAQRAGGRTPAPKGLAAQVDALGGALERASDSAIREESSALRIRLRAEGLTRELVARAFALTREAAKRAVGMRHHDVQLAGGWAMVNGMLAEMETGEGKTLAATLPACTAALAGIPVHIITVNDYLVERDSSWMRPVYETLGISVGAITEAMDFDARREAYACDVTYCANKQVAFDYLKDRIVLGNEPGRLRLELEHLYKERPRLERLLLRGLCFAIVDEADSVLIDEARTPLIISSAGDAGEQRRIYEEALILARPLRMASDIVMDPRDRRIELTARGARRLEEAAAAFDGLWRGPRRREQLVKQALDALHLFERDKHYLVRDGKVQIIDEFTGRVMQDRSWERGLHQMIEAKEGCELTGQKETLAKISYQRFFRRYLRLAGMTGTAREVSAELWSVYRLKVAFIPPHRAVRRRAFPDRLFRSAEAKWARVREAIVEQHDARRPVLVGTRSVAASEHLSELLNAAGLAHRILNARQDQEEAEIVGDAGEAGRITVATNIAGRGTDIRLGPGVAAMGGLHVIATERHEAGRIDRQLFGRCGRQGDPGSYQAIICLEDELFDVYAPPVVVWLARRFVGDDRDAAAPLARWVVRAAQGNAERRHARVRQQLLKMDERLGTALAFSGRGE